MIHASVKVDAAAFNKYLKEAPEKVAAAIGNVVRKAAFIVEREGKIKAPVDTGRLRSSIAAEIRPRSAEVHTNVAYARYVHDGTRHITARPFLDDAAKVAEDQITGIVMEELKKLE